MAFDSALYLSIYDHISFQTRETKAHFSEALLTQTKTGSKRPNRFNWLNPIFKVGLGFACSTAIGITTHYRDSMMGLCVTQWCNCSTAELS